MRYSIEPKYGKYVEEYFFCCLFQKTFGDKYGEKLIIFTTKTGIDAAKTASKRVVRKAAEATGDLIGNKMADKITSAVKLKNKGKEEDNEVNNIHEIYIPPEKHQQIIVALRLF